MEKKHHSETAWGFAGLPAQKQTWNLAVGGGEILEDALLPQNGAISQDILNMFCLF